MYSNEIVAHLHAQLVPAILQSFILLVERYEVNSADLPNLGSFSEPIKLQWLPPQEDHPL